MVSKGNAYCIFSVIVVSISFSSCRTGKGLEGDKKKVKFEIEEENISSSKKNNSGGNSTDGSGTGGSYSYSLIRSKYAAQLGVGESEISNVFLYEFIDTWMGVPYKWAGNTKEGVDCSGFVCAVYKDVYVKQLKRSAVDIAKECEIIEKSALREGDLVFFDISSQNSHIGIYLANSKFIHASSSKGVMISDLNHTYYVNHWGRAGRVK